MIGRKRGPYKSYLHPGNKVVIPKTTKEVKKKRSTKNTFITAEITDPISNVAGPTNNQARPADPISIIRPTTNNQDSPRPEYDVCSSSNEDHPIEQHYASGISDPESSIQPSSDEDEQIFSDTASDTDNNSHGSESNYLQIESESSTTPNQLDSSFFEGLCKTFNFECKKSKFDILLLVLIYSIRHNLTTVAITDLLKLINTVLGTDIIPDSKYLFSKVFQSEIKLTYHIYCQLCMTYLGVVPPDARSSYAINCSSCDNRVLYSIDNNQPSIFVTISMTDQLQTLFESRKDLQDKLKYRFERPVSSETVSDIFDGLFYKGFCANDGILGSKDNFSLTFNTDGAPVFHSSKCSIWPLQFFINELPPDIRFKSENVMLAGLWFGSKDPRMDVFMIPFVEEATKLYNQGINWRSKIGKIINSKVVVLCCCLDSVARPMVQGIKQFNGYFGCAYCLHPGDKIEKNQIRFTESAHSKIKERTNEMIREDMENAVNTSTIVNGVKTMSPLYVLPHFDLVYGFVIDYMHCVLLGITRTLTNLWLDSTNHQQPYYIGLCIEEVDNRLTNITPPSCISRFPRSLNTRAHWKANEWRNWLLFYSLPCLEGILPKRYFEHFSILVYSIYVLLKEEMTYDEVDFTNNCLHLFVREYEENYGKISMTYNVHLLKHLAKNVSLWGPLWAYSAFVFENGNGILLQLIKGTTGVGTQIVNKYIRYMSVPWLLENMEVQDDVLTFCSQLMTIPSLKNAVKTEGSITLIGLPRTADLSEEELLAFEEKGVPATNFFYQRIIFLGKKYSCTMYDKQRKSSDCTAVLISGHYIQIKRFIVIGNETYIMCENIKIKTRDKSLFFKGIKNKVHIHSCERHDRVFLRLAREIVNVGLLLKVGVKNFVSKFPNLYEKD